MTVIREYWIQSLWKMASPLLIAGDTYSIKKNMPVRSVKGRESYRANYSHLEACARILSGLAPWLELDDVNIQERPLHTKSRILAQHMLSSIVDPSSPDYLNFGKGDQPLVDAAYLVQAIKRSPKILWHGLRECDRERIVNAFQLSRKIKPYNNNWILFSAIIEAFFCSIGIAYSRAKIYFAVKSFEGWYVGDGMYRDGPNYHCDYYNSFAIHPFLIDIVDLSSRSIDFGAYQSKIMVRAQRYCEVLERSISSDGSFPVVGRSLTYRTGILHIVALLSLMNKLPKSICPSQSRYVMTTVIKKLLDAEHTYCGEGWLNIGLIGHQPGLAEHYISTGSLYMASEVFLPLGLASSDVFWSEEAPISTSFRLFSGVDTFPDVALEKRLSLF